MKIELQCKECQRSYPPGADYFCEYCLAPLEVLYPIDPRPASDLRREIETGPDNIWRYKSFLPCADTIKDPLPAGMTPLIAAPRLAEKIGIKAELWVKSELANPTHSFKDRVAAVACAKAHEWGLPAVACASTGNLAHAVAARAAAYGLDAYLFVPEDLEAEKILAMSAYGAKVVTVSGNYDHVNRLCVQLAEEKEWGFVNINLRPYYSQGSKTIAFEIIEQLNWGLPDSIVCPIASGSLFTKLAAGIKEWQDAGLVQDTMPRFHGAQARGCGPVATAFENHEDYCQPQKPKTIAKSLAIGDPADGNYALELARKSQGSVTSVSETEIREGISMLAETTGIFTETAGGVTIATLAKLAKQGAFDKQSQVVAVITGDGLKTPRVLQPQSQSWEEFNRPKTIKRQAAPALTIAS